jgi:carbon monoxide dehydrogenase subunit G
VPHAERTVTIARPVSDVFAFVADGEHGMRWRPGVLDVKRESGQGVGEIYRQGVRGPGGRRIAADYRITAFEPDRSLAFEAIAGPVRPTGGYRFEPEGAGTRLTFTLDAQLSGLKKLFMGGMVQKSMDAEMGALDTLKRVLENPGS